MSARTATVPSPPPTADSAATLAQRRAADPARSVWVGASAGSGKTKVLTDRLLRLLLPRTDGEPGSAANRILCLTFTRAAAREMALRLNKRLAAWAARPEEWLTGDLAQLLGREPQEAERRAARRLFAEVTDAPGGLRIMTIHAFCQSVLGRFPLEAGLSPAFTALDEVQASALRDAALNDTLAAAARQPNVELGQALALLTPQVSFDDLTKLLGAVLKEYRQLEHLTKADDIAGDLRSHLAEAFGLDPAAGDETAILRAAFAAGAFDEALLREAAALMIGDGGANNTKRGGVIAALLGAPAATRHLGWRGYMRGFLKLDMEPFKDGAMTKRLAARHPAHAEALAAEAERLLGLHDTLKAAQSAGLSHALLLLGIVVWRCYDAAKAARGALDFDDLINKTLSLLGQPGIAPWIMFKLDGGLDHLLIDEAQDTNPAQWAIAKRLTDDFFSGLGTREEMRRTVFAVGDEKQSIFGFQGARPDEFYKARAHFSAAITDGSWWTERLHTSFRTVPGVLRFVDAVFDDDALRAGVSDEAVRHAAERQGHPGLVELWPLFATPEKEDRAAFAPPVGIRDSRSGASRLAEHIGEQVASWLAAGDLLPSTGLPVRPGDILILVRRRSAFVGQMIRALKTRGVPVSGVDRMVLKEQLAVQDLLAAAQFALLPDDDLSLACLLKSPLVGWDDARLEKLAYKRGGTLWAALSASGETDLRNWLDGLIAASGRERPYEFFSRLLEAPCPADAKSGLHAMSARLGPEALDPLQEFLNAALTAERHSVPSIQSFLLAVTRGNDEIKREQDEGAGAVRIMTVHGAKGLEAPIVILPDTVRSSRRPAGMDAQRLLWPDRSGLAVPVWSPRAETDCAFFTVLYERFSDLQDEEYRRLLYVALTRAADRLYIGGHAGRRKSAERGWYDYMAAAMDRLPDAEAAPFASRHFLRTEDAPPPMLRRLRDAAALAPLPGAPVAAAPPPVALPDWLYAWPAAEPEPTYPLTPSRPAAEPAAASPLAPADPHRFRRGIVTHRLLQFLPDLPEASRTGQASRFLARQAADLPEATRDSIAAETLAILANPDWAALFGPDSLAEISVTGQAGGRLVSGQVDRLYLNDDAVWVVDYKTNRPPPATPSGIPAVYRAQMAAYRDVIAAIYPGRAVRCFLLWTDGPVLMPVDVA